MFGGFGQQQQPQQPPQQQAQPLGLTSTSGALVPLGAPTSAQPTLGFGVNPAPSNPTTSLFGARPNTGSLFGSTAATTTATPFGSTPATNPSGAATSSLFGGTTTGSALFGTPSATTSAGLFGSNPASSNIFGSQPQQRSNSLFGVDGSAATQQQQQGASGSLFGTSSNLFGSNAGIASSTPSTNTFSFGSSTTQPSTSGFGSTSTNIFGSAFATTTPSLNTGTGSPPFTTTSDTDGATTTVLHSITAMPAYRSKSFEELRLEDYAKGKKTPGYGPPGMSAGTQPQQPQSTASIFGQSTSNPFNFGGQTTQQQQQPQPGQLGGGLFQSTSSQQPTPTTGFGFGAGATQGPPATANVFGATQPSVTGGFGGFGATPAASGFGIGAGFATAQPPNANPFGTAAPSTTTAASGFFASSTQPPQGASLSAFGQPAPPTALGASFASPFGATQQQQQGLGAGTGFGTGASNIFGKPAVAPAAPATGALFGASPGVSSNVFGSAAPSSFLTPASTATGATPTNPFGSSATTTSTGLFGQPQQPSSTSLFGATLGAPGTGTGTGTGVGTGAGAGAGALGGFKSPFSTFGTVTPVAASFGQPASTGLGTSNPFATVQQAAINPFATPGASSSLFGTPAASGSTATSTSAPFGGGAGTSTNPFAASSSTLPTGIATTPGFSLGSGTQTAAGGSFGWGSSSIGASVAQPTAATTASAPLTPFTQPFVQPITAATSTTPGLAPFGAQTTSTTGPSGWPTSLTNNFLSTSQQQPQQQSMPGLGTQTLTTSVSDRKSYGTHPWLDAPSTPVLTTPSQSSAKSLSCSSFGSTPGHSPTWRGTYSVGGLASASVPASSGVSSSIPPSLTNASVNLLRASRHQPNGAVGGPSTVTISISMSGANDRSGLTVRRSNRKLIIEPKNRLTSASHPDGIASQPSYEPSYKPSYEPSYKPVLEPQKPIEMAPRYLGPSLRVAEDDDLGDGYYCSPSAVMLYESALRGSPVEFLKIGQMGAGLIEYTVPVQLGGLLESGFNKELFIKRLKSLVVFDKLTVAVYPEPANEDDSGNDNGWDATGRPRLKKPPVGSGLNNPAIVSVESCRPIQKGASSDAPMDIRVVQIFIDRLKHVPDTQFLEYKANAAVWVFKVEHF